MNIAVYSKELFSIQEVGSRKALTVVSSITSGPRRGDVGGDNDTSEPMESSEF